MAETIKKTTGRPRKGGVSHKPNKSGWGGKREGAGRKKTENPRSKMLPFRVTEETLRRTSALRELTKDDAMPFVAMLEAWIADYAKDYGID